MYYNQNQYRFTGITYFYLIFCLFKFSIRTSMDCCSESTLLRSSLLSWLSCSTFALRSGLSSSVLGWRSTNFLVAWIISWLRDSDLNTAPTLFIGSYYQLLIRQEVVEQKYALSSSDPEDKIFSIAITRSRSCLEDGGDIWSHVWTSCMDFSVVVGV